MTAASMVGFTPQDKGKSQIYTAWKLSEYICDIVQTIQISHEMIQVSDAIKQYTSFTKQNMLITSKKMEKVILNHAKPQARHQREGFKFRSLHKRTTKPLETMSNQ